MDETDIQSGDKQSEYQEDGTNTSFEVRSRDDIVESVDTNQNGFEEHMQNEQHNEVPDAVMQNNLPQENTNLNEPNLATNNPGQVLNTEKDPEPRVISTDNKNDSNYANSYFYSDPKTSVTVQISTVYGVLIEIFFVPETYRIADIKTILVRDTGIENESLLLDYKGEVAKSETLLITLADEKKMLKLSAFIRNAEDSLKFKLGCRELLFPSGLIVKIIGRKFMVTKDPHSQKNIMLVHRKDGTTTKNEYVHIDWLPHDHHKPFLGGYRNIITECRYHNASAQTKPIPRKVSDLVKTSRDTQTYKMRHFGNTTVNHMSTQFSKPGFFVANSQDKVKTPGPYESADEYLARVLKKIIIIQKYIRRWLAKKRVAKLKKMRDDYLAWEKAHAQEYKDEIAKRIQRDFERRLHPQTAADFDRLYNALEAWRREEVSKIESKKLTEAERKAALALLLDEEAELIAAITRHQISVSKKNAENIKSLCLKKAAAPHQWTSAIDGRLIEVATAETIRAKELLDIYESLSLECLTHNERLDILLTLKQTVSPYNSKIAKEILGLVDREAELIMRGIPHKYLFGLRQRIRNRFIQFAKSPCVNPEVGKHLPVPISTKGTVSPFAEDIQYCMSCGRYLKKNSFPLSARATRLVPCKSCRRNDNRGRARLDLEPYQYILIELRQNENRLVEKMKKLAIENARELELQRLERGESPKPDTDDIINGVTEDDITINPIPFLINKEDIRFLIDQIWESRSALSGWTNLFDLTLTRWNMNEPWAPWNTIVVTREEAEIHISLSKLKIEEIYADHLINLVNQRLVMGKNEFIRLYNNGYKMAKEVFLKNKRMQNPENTSNWLKEKRHKLPPLMTVPKHLLTASHEPTYQPPDSLLPVIKGEKRLSSLVKDTAVTN